MLDQHGRHQRPLDELDSSHCRMRLRAAARLLIAERLVATGASEVEVAVGPLRAGSRLISAVLTDPRAYSNEQPARRQIHGQRAADTRLKTAKCTSQRLSKLRA